MKSKVFKQGRCQRNKLSPENILRSEFLGGLPIARVGISVILLLIMIFGFQSALSSYAANTGDPKETVRPDSSVGSSESNNQKSPLILCFDAGRFLSRPHHFWIPSWTARVGIGINATSPRLFLFLDYYQFKIGDYDGFGYFITKSATRKEFALYFCANMFGFFEIGGGEVLMISDEVILKDLAANSTEQWIGSKSRQLFPFITLGFQYEIGIGAGFAVPIGLHYRTIEFRADELFPWTLRIGLTKEL